jgi:hypothetical protein
VGERAGPDSGWSQDWNDIPGWFQWRSAQEEAVHRFPEGSRFVEVGNFLGRSLCSLGEVAQLSGKSFTLIGLTPVVAAAPKARAARATTARR